jgi:2-polyprenyl-6-methoxyphenol hydroxylase-like FAD-dependent oxidoreductase
MHPLAGHAVVIGASMAGLLAARAAAGAYDRVTVVERDELPDGIADRRAVPQGRHIHSLLPHGQACLDALLPGLTRELAAAGAPVYRAMEELRLVFDGRPLARPSLGLEAVVASRALIEGHVRRRVLGLPNLQAIDRCDAVGLVLDGERVTGVRLLRRTPGSAEELLPADLVIAATGRAARLPAWLADHGFERPAEERLAVDVRYVSRRLRLAPGSLGPDKLVLIGPRPGLARSLGVFAQEDGAWLMTAGGYGERDRPPTEPEALEAFAATVAPPDVRAALRDAEPLDAPVAFGFPAQVRRRYERLRRFPRGLLVTGDAICSFNPIYGQGMTVAAAEALALRGCLETGDADLARRFFSAIGPTIDDAWTLATGADLALPEVAGHRPARVRAINAYLRRLRAVAEHDPQVAGAFAAVVGMRERPPHVLRPATVLRVARGPRPRTGAARADGLLSDLRVGGASRRGAGAG